MAHNRILSRRFAALAALAALAIALAIPTACSEASSAQSHSGAAVTTPQGHGSFPTVSSSGSGSTPSFESQPASDPSISADAAPTPEPDLNPSPATQEAYETAIAKLRESKTVEAAFAVAETIEDLGRSVASLLEADLPELEIHAKVAAYRTLFGLGRFQESIKGLCNIAATEGVSRAIRLSAAETLSNIAWERHKDDIAAALEATHDAPVAIELAVALWNTSRSLKAKQRLNDILKSTSANFRQQAALALGRLPVPDLTNCRDIIQAIADEPTDRGRIAEQILQRDRIGKQLDLALQRVSGEGAADGEIEIDTAILDKVRGMLIERSIFTDRTTLRRLTLAAAAGVLAHLDPYTVYLDAAQSRRAAEIRRFEVPTLGISFGAAPLRTNATLLVPTVMAVAPGSPADRAGLKPGDKILGVAPKATLSRVLEWRHGADFEHGEVHEDFLDMKLGGMVDAMLPKGDVSDASKPQSMAMRIRRDGWYFDRWVPLTHAEPAYPSLTHQALPGEIGYIRINRLDADAPASFLAALKAIEAAKSKGLLIDLRNSAGGSFPAAIKVASMLLEKDTVITSVKGRDASLITSEEIKAHADHTNTTLPITVLVNGGTCDGAELLAAALKETGRATLAGTNTGGRAHVQELINLDTEIPQDGAAAIDEGQPNREQHSILLTVGYYYTPVSNRRISEGGIEPSVEARRDGFAGWVYDQLDELRGDGSLVRYVTNLIKAHEATALTLAENDGGSTAAYPEWTEFRAALAANNLEDSHLRHEIRRELRAHLIASGKLKSFADLQSDSEFVVGLKSLAASAGIDLSSVKEYATLSTR